MNYFLHYDNSNPLFIGGLHHGQKHRVPLAYRHWRLAVPAKLDSYSFRTRLTFADKIPDHEVHAYREQWFHANGREFRLFVQEHLPSDAAFMLLMSTCASSHEMQKRIKDLEAENRTLRKLIEVLSQHP